MSYKFFICVIVCVCVCVCGWVKQNIRQELTVRVRAKKFLDASGSNCPRNGYRYGIHTYIHSVHTQTEVVVALKHRQQTNTTLLNTGADFSSSSLGASPSALSGLPPLPPLSMFLFCHQVASQIH